MLEMWQGPPEESWVRRKNETDRILQAVASSSCLTPGCAHDLLKWEKRAQAYSEDHVFICAGCKTEFRFSGVTVYQPQSDVFKKQASEH
jgi:hypothetical protein